MFNFPQCLVNRMRGQTVTVGKQLLSDRCRVDAGPVRSTAACRMKSWQSSGGWKTVTHPLPYLSSSYCSRLHNRATHWHDVPSTQPPLPPSHLPFLLPASYTSWRQTTVVLMEAKKSCKLTSVSISIFWPSRAPVGRRCGGQPSIIGPRLINEEGLTQQKERERAGEGGMESGGVRRKWRDSTASVNPSGGEKVTETWSALIHALHIHERRRVPSLAFCAAIFALRYCLSLQMHPRCIQLVFVCRNSNATGILIPTLFLSQSASAAGLQGCRKVPSALFPPSHTTAVPSPHFTFFIWIWPFNLKGTEEV